MIFLMCRDSKTKNMFLLITNSKFKSDKTTSRLQILYEFHEDVLLHEEKDLFYFRQATCHPVLDACRSSDIHPM